MDIQLALAIVALILNGLLVPIAGTAIRMLWSHERRISRLEAELRLEHAQET